MVINALHMLTVKQQSAHPPLPPFAQNESIKTIRREHASIFNEHAATPNMSRVRRSSAQKALMGGAFRVQARHRGVGLDSA